MCDLGILTGCNKCNTNYEVLQIYENENMKGFKNNQLCFSIERLWVRFSTFGGQLNLQPVVCGGQIINTRFVSEAAVLRQQQLWVKVRHSI